MAGGSIKLLKVGSTSIDNVRCTTTTTSVGQRMKITKVVEVISEYIETDDDGIYRRYSSDSWEQRLGESWEPVYECAELEAIYQAFKKQVGD